MLQSRKAVTDGDGITIRILSDSQGARVSTRERLACRVRLRDVPRGNHGYCVAAGREEMTDLNQQWEAWTEQGRNAAVAAVMGWKAQHNPLKCDGKQFIKCSVCGQSGHGNCYGNGSGAMQIKCGAFVSCCEDAEMPEYINSEAEAFKVIQWWNAQTISNSVQMIVRTKWTIVMVCGEPPKPRASVAIVDGDANAVTAEAICKAIWLAVTEPELMKGESCKTKMATP